MKKKYRVSVDITAHATKSIGVVEFDTLEEYNDKANKLWEKQGFDYPTANRFDDFDLGDWEINSMEETDLQYLKNE